VCLAVPTDSGTRGRAQSKLVMILKGRVACAAAPQHVGAGLLYMIECEQVHRWRILQEVLIVVHKRLVMCLLGMKS
jgi:hypothetical protein